ncbi:MAG: hypothetical protein P4L46_20670 [Fimbriimonas sp.]|nr:hypothetical protein [Fimbriimonas sp.]
MKKCPSCNNSLPDSSVRCQFCGTDVAGAPRVQGVTDIPQRQSYSWGPAKWLVVAYYVISGYYILSGGFGILASSGLLTGGKPNMLGIGSGVFTALVGCGLVFKWDLLRSVIVFFLCAQIACGLLSMLMFSAMLALGPAITVMMILYGLNVAVSAFMFYLFHAINEDTYG